MTPNTTRPRDPRDTDPETPGTEPAADLHPDVRAVMQATDALPVHDDEGPPVIELPTETGTVRASIPTHATDREAAVIAVAITAHLRDEAADAEADGPEPADRWRLAARLPGRATRGLRNPPVAGEAWKLAGRCAARRQ
jgi:hypothetical protein